MTYVHPEIRALMALDSDDWPRIRFAPDGDAWGWAMGHSFAISANLYARRWVVPAKWKYRNPWAPEHERGIIAETWPDSEYSNLIDAGAIGANDLRRAGNVLNRYCRILVRGGKDY